MTRFRRILVASDFSRGSAKAFDTAAKLAKANRAAVIVLHVLVPIVPFASERYVPSVAFGQVELATRTWARQQLAGLVQKAKRAGVRASALLLEGDAAPQIVRTARSKRCDLLVVGTHGRTGLSRVVLGSVAQRVVATASCPVVTVRSR